MWRRPIGGKIVRDSNGKATATHCLNCWSRAEGRYMVMEIKEELTLLLYSVESHTLQPLTVLHFDQKAGKREKFPYNSSSSGFRSGKSNE